MGTFSHKVVWFVWHETLHTTLFGKYYCIEIVRIKKFICLILRAKLLFKGFLITFSTFSHKVFQTWFIWHKTWHTTLFGIYYCIEMFESKTIVMCLKLRAKFNFRVFYAFLALARIKWFKLGFFGTKLAKQHYLLYIIVLKWLEFKRILICLK